MFLKVLYGGCDILTNEEDSDEDLSCSNDLILSVAQDIIFGVSGGKKCTPKHIGLGCSLHQATRSKQLVQLFHKAGHIVSYKKVLQIDTALAEVTLSSMDRTTGAVLPINLVEDRFVHFTADNIDILDSSLDGKDTFHATQLAAWQRGPGKNENVLQKVKASSRETLVVPPLLNILIPANIIEGNSPVFKNNVPPELMACDDDSPEVVSADAKDLAFIMTHNNSDSYVSWTRYNQGITTGEQHC